MNNFYSLTVSGVVQNTPSSVTLTFDVPKDLSSKFQFVAGQYITIKKEINGEEVRRAYSICTTPNSNMLSVGIKKVADGRFSTYANAEVKVGDVLEVMPPDGRFVLDNTINNVTCFAAGSGITPILSIITSLLEANTTNKAVLVYGNKSSKETMFYKELEGLKQQYQDRFAIVYTYSQAQEENALFGRIEKSTVNYAKKNALASTNFDAYYLCGPEEMIHLVSDTLKENGIADDNINYELFTAASNDTTADTGSIAEGESTITIMLDDEETTFTMDKSKYILDVILKEDLDPPYSCQGGVCSSCIAKVTTGEAKMVKNQILTDSEVAEGLILTCQAHATTATITVDFDDV